MDRRESARLFRLRIVEAMAVLEYSHARLARQVEIDRSTLSQLLAADKDRLPRADTAAAIAQALNVSLDWLLGLSSESRLGADILHESLEVTHSPPTPANAHITRWRDEALGYKIRYVPTTLPDLAKTDRVIEHEYRDFVARSAEQELADSQGKLAYTQLPETDMEICMPVQNVEGFVLGEGTWRDLPVAARAAQLDRLIDLTEALYPTLRLFLYDGLSHYSVPLTVFGPLRAVIYVGQMYFAFNTTEHVRVLTRHFDGLIRAAVVQAPETPAFLTGLRARLVEGTG